MTRFIARMSVIIVIVVVAVAVIAADLITSGNSENVDVELLVF
jgi:hypothetical protein